MSIASEITRLQGAKSALKTAINAKTDAQHQINNELLDDYATFVDSIQAGGGSSSKFKELVDGSITTVTAEDLQGITSINASAFRGRINLTNITIPSGVTSIGNSAFDGCRGLTSITIPSGVTSIGDSAFNGCRGLTSITIPSGVTSIGNNLFNSCSGLTSVTIPNSVTSIGSGAFYSCTGLTEIIIPNSVRTIGTSAISYCSGLTSVTIGSGVISIGSGAFAYCTGLTGITINATTPPTLVNIAALTNTNDCPIYVPSASVSAYQSATNWSTYASRIQAIPE